VREILIISTPDDLRFRRLLGGVAVGFLSPMRAAASGRLAQAYIIGAPFVEGHRSVLVLGDNIFYGHGLTELLHEAGKREQGATVSPIMSAIRALRRRRIRRGRHGDFA